MKNKVLRKCRGCNLIQNRENMIKITLYNDELYINPNSKITGRSVYVCKNSDCIKMLIKNKGIKKALKFSDDKKIKAAEELIMQI